MRTKRKALHSKPTRPPGSAKDTVLLSAGSIELSVGVKPEDLARLENEGGATSQISEIGETSQATTNALHETKD